jgi:DNA-binding response OmpR family regulator
MIVTSSEATEDIEEHKKLRTRAEDYLLKPYSIDELLGRVNALIGLAVRRKKPKRSTRPPSRSFPSMTRLSKRKSLTALRPDLDSRLVMPTMTSMKKPSQRLRRWVVPETKTSRATPSGLRSCC